MVSRQAGRLGPCPLLCQGRNVPYMNIAFLSVGATCHGRLAV